MSWGHDQRMEALKLLVSWDVQDSAHMWGLSPCPHLAQVTGSETGEVRELPPTGLS